MAALYPLYLESGASATLKLRLTDIEPLAGLDTDSPRSGIITSPAHAERAAGVPGTDDFAAGFDALFTTRQKEAEEFYESRIPKTLSADAKAVMRQSFAGMFWSDRKSTRLNSSHGYISYAVFCLKKKKHDTKYSAAPIADRVGSGRGTFCRLRRRMRERA